MEMQKEILFLHRNSGSLQLFENSNKLAPIKMLLVNFVSLFVSGWFFLDRPKMVAFTALFTVSVFYLFVVVTIVIYCSYITCAHLLHAG